MTDDQSYLVPAERTLIPPAPFIVHRHCSTCGRQEVFHSDRLRKQVAVLTSFEPGHAMDDREVAADLRALAAIADRAN